MISSFKSESNIGTWKVSSRGWWSYKLGRLSHYVLSSAFAYSLLLKLHSLNRTRTCSTTRKIILHMYMKLKIKFWYTWLMSAKSIKLVFHSIRFKVTDFCIRILSQKGKGCLFRTFRRMIKFKQNIYKFVARRIKYKRHIFNILLVDCISWVIS